MEMLQMMLHSKKLNYNRLNGILPQYIPQRTNEYDTVNVIVDLYDVVKQLYKPQLLEQINHMKASDRYQITSEIINIIGHYRHYFASRLWKYTNIYFIYSDSPSAYHTSVFSDYRKDFYKKRLDSGNETFGILTKIIKENFKLIKNFIEYVPHCYFINTGDVEYTLAPYIMYTERIVDTTIPTMLVSNEEIYFQDFAHNEKLIQLLVKGDKSRIVTKENMWDEIVSGVKNKPDISLFPELYPVVLACTGYNGYDVPKVNRMGVARAIPFITKELLDKGYINNIDYSSIEIFEESINNSSIKEEYKERIIENFKLLSHSAVGGLAYTKRDVDSIRLQCSVDRIDPKSITYINERYFTNYPILMDYVFEGEQYA